MSNHKVFKNLAIRSKSLQTCRDSLRKLLGAIEQTDLYLLAGSLICLWAG